MAGEWRASTWGEEISLEYGKALRDYDKASGKYRVFGSNGPIGWTDKPLASGPGVILGRKGAYRGIEFSHAPFFVIDTAYYVVPKSEFDMRWLYYAIKHHKLGEIDDGSPIPSTTRSAVYVRDFDVPPLAEQKAIAAVLGALDDKIELNRRMNATLEAMARALFQSWFVDFDPVRAKLDGRKPIGMDAATAALFPEHFDHKAEGVVPTGWNLKRWGDIATLEYGKSIRDYRESNGKYRVWGTNGPIGFHEEALCNSAGIVIGRKGAYRGVHYSPEPFFVIDTAFYLKPKVPLDLKWAYYELLQFDINSMDSGSAIPSTSRDDFYGIPVIVPPPAIQDAFGKIVGGWFAKVFANDHESRTLATLRDTLLPKLLSGELSLPAALLAAQAGVAGGNYSALSNSSNRRETNP
jgi:type I restriction enzyme S subunit